jgi:hypothetical protein
MYGFAHQAYFGFRFLAEKRPGFWKEVLDAKTASSIQEVGRACSQPRAMAKAGYGAAGLMTWLVKSNVALQVIAAKQHRRYPDSNRPSSEDRRMIFLAIAVAAGIWEREFSTALRILAEAGLGPESMAEEVHRFDRLEEKAKLSSLVWAEPVENYCYPVIDGKWEPTRKLPCKVPADCRGGFIIHGYGSDGPQSTYSPTLPPELLESLEPLVKEGLALPRRSMTSGPLPRKTCAPNSVRCRCGAEISAQSKELALQALAEHERLVHGTKRGPSRCR